MTTTDLIPAENTAELGAPFPVHPAAELFPLMQGADFDAFVEDIRVSGQQEPVVLDADGRLLDGRNRARACTSLGLRITTRRYDGDDPMQFVISHNLHRRHLTDSQRAMIAAELATLAMGHRPVPDGTGDLTGANVRTLMQVSSGSLNRAKIIHRDGTPNLRELAKEVSLPLETAARVARTSPAEQDAYVEQVRGGASAMKTAPPAPTHAKSTGPAPTPPSRFAMPQPPRYGGNRRKHLQVLDALATALAGASIAAADIEAAGLDSTVTAEEATRLTGDLSTSIRSLQRINNLLKERTR